MINRATFLKDRAVPALYLAGAFYVCALVMFEFDRHFYELRPNLLSQVSDALSWFFAPAFILTLAVDGNPHAPNSPLLYAFGFAEAYLAAFVIVLSASAIRRRAADRKFDKQPEDTPAP